MNKVSFFVILALLKFVTFNLMLSYTSVCNYSNRWMPAADFRCKWKLQQPPFSKHLPQQHQVPVEHQSGSGIPCQALLPHHGPGGTQQSVRRVRLWLCRRLWRGQSGRHPAGLLVWPGATLRHLHGQQVVGGPPHGQRCGSQRVHGLLSWW